VAAKAASRDGQSGRSVRQRLMDRGLNDDLLIGDRWSYGLRTVSLKEEGGARATQMAGGLGKEQRWLLVGVGCSGGRGEWRGEQG
jgi:hypothetical protein